MPDTFRMTFLTAPGSSVEDASTDIPLSPEPSFDLSSSFVTALKVSNADGIVDVIDASDGLTSFREAIVDANTNPGDDKIVLEAGTYILGISGADEDGALTGDIDVIDTTGKLTIVGAGAGLTIIDGNALDRVFHVLPGGDLEIQDVTIRGGFASTATSAFGGAIANEAGTVTIVNSVISGNTALDGAGATARPPAAAAPAPAPARPAGPPPNPRRSAAEHPRAE